MIRHLNNNDIDRTKWDQCIRSSFNGLIYGYSWYLDIMAEGWDALVKGDYQAVFPLTGAKKYGISYLFQPRFTQQLGIFSTDLLSEETIEEFLNAIPKHYRLVDINLNSFNKLKTPDKRIRMWDTYELDLIRSYKQIAAGFSQNLRRNIKKATGNKINVVKNMKPEEIIHLFRENKGKKMPHLQQNHYQKLRRMVYVALYKGMASVYGAFTPDNQLCAGAIFLISNKKAIFLFSGMDKTGRDNNAMSLLIDTFIRDNARHHLTLDFEGSNQPGLARFYSSFGSVKCRYPHLYMNRLPWVVSIALSAKRAFFH